MLQTVIMKIQDHLYNASNSEKLEMHSRLLLINSVSKTIKSISDIDDNWNEVTIVKVEQSIQEKINI
jgi:hypothetical protein